MNENPYRSPSAVEAEPSKAGFTWLGRFLVLTLIVNIVWASFVLSMLPMCVVFELFPSFRFAVMHHLGDSIVIGVLGLPAGVMTAALLSKTRLSGILSSDERQQRAGLKWTGVFVAGVMILFGVLLYLTGV